MEEGLLLPPNPLVNLIIESCLSRAQKLHKATICHYLFEMNHLHLILIVENPAAVTGFMGRLKTETAHAINRMLGRTKRTVWCEGYDSPPVLTLESVIEKIAYTYSNPAKDCLEKSITNYPGLSSWNAFNSNGAETNHPWIRRYMVPCITEKSNYEIYKKAKELKNKVKKTHSLRIDPDAWMNAFNIEDPKYKAEINNRIKERVREIELAFEEIRTEEKKSVIGRERLINQPMDTTYRSNRKGKKMWCISSDTYLRKQFISGVKELIKEGKRVLQEWRKGNLSVPYPPGLFPPSMPKLTELIGHVDPIYS